MKTELTMEPYFTTAPVKTLTDGYILTDKFVFDESTPAMRIGDDCTVWFVEFNRK